MADVASEASQSHPTILAETDISFLESVTLETHMHREKDCRHGSNLSCPAGLTLPEFHGLASDSYDGASVSEASIDRCRFAPSSVITKEQSICSYPAPPAFVAPSCILAAKRSMQWLPSFPPETQVSVMTAWATSNLSNAKLPRRLYPQQSPRVCSLAHVSEAAETDFCTCLCGLHLYAGRDATRAARHFCSYLLPYRSDASPPL